MDEAKRFLRFVLPGLAVVLEFGLFLSILRPSQVARFLSEHMQSIGGIGTALTLFVGSGGLGFILSSLYHSISWGPFSGYLAINHKRMIEDAVRNNSLRLIEQGTGERVQPDRISRRDAWRIATAVWHGRLGRSDRLRGANARTDSLTSIVHGVGTLTTGTILVVCLSLYMHLTTPVHCSSVWVFWGLLVLLPISQSVAYWVAVGHAQRVIDMILFEELRLGGSLEWYVPLRRVSFLGWTWWH